VRFGPVIKIFFSIILLGIAGLLGYQHRTDIKDLLMGHRSQDDAVPIKIETFFRAIAQNDIDAVRSELDKDATVVKYNFPGGGTGLHIAVQHGFTDIAKLLIDKGADLESRGQWGGTPLHWACLSGFPDCERLLIERGAQVEARCQAFGSTPMLWTAYGSSQLPDREKQYEQIADDLYKAGASCDTLNNSGVPAIQMASPGVAKFMKDHGAHAPVPAPSAPQNQPKEEVL
jgi:ankyrin repeat protein